MKLIQLNAWGGRLDNALKQFLKDEAPDIVCLQEAIDLEQGRGALFISVDEIKESIGAKHHYMSPAFSLNYMQRKANFGNCIISKFPILKKETIFTGREYIADFDWTKHTQNIRNLQHIELQLPRAERLHVFNHHGHHIHEHKNGDNESMRQCQIIADKIKAVDGKVILTGDFNLAPHSKSLAVLNHLLKNLSVQAKLKTTRTLLSPKSEVCDYIFVSRDIIVQSFVASNQLVSDHKALILSFK